MTVVDHTDDHRLVNRWCADQHRQGLSDETVCRRRAEVRNLLCWLHARNVELLSADSGHIEAWLGSRKIGAQARYSYISYAASFYGWAVWVDLIDTAPTDRVRRPKLPHHLPRPISNRDLATALERAEPRTKAMVALGAFAGLRCKEIAGVRREDIIDCMKPPTIFVARGKGGRQRVVPLNPLLWAALRSYGLPREGWLFPGRDGTEPLTSRRVSMIISRHFQDCGINDRAHALRHWFGSSVYRRSLDLRLTQEALGHASPATTALYTALVPGQASEIITRLDLPDDDEDT